MRLEQQQSCGSRKAASERDKLACTADAATKMDASTVAVKLAPIRKNAVPNETRPRGPQAFHAVLVLNQVLPDGNEFGIGVPPLSHKQITHLLRIAVMGITCRFARHARSPAVLARLHPACSPVARRGLGERFLLPAALLVGGQRRGRSLRRPQG